MKEDILKVLVSEEEIQKRVRELAAQIEKDYAGRDVMMVCILKGSVMFFADLCKYIDLSVIMDFMAVSSYGSGTESTGKLKIKKDLTESVVDRDVILVEDIVDSGFTLTHLKSMILKRGAASVKIVSLLDKPTGRRPGITLEPDYNGFTVGNEFVVGYGLDFAEKYRNLPYVGVLKPEIYENIL